MAKEPLYPHVPKARKMVSEAVLTKYQKDAGLYLVRSDDTIELRDKAGKPLRVFSSRATIAEIREVADKSLAADVLKRDYAAASFAPKPYFYYYCDRAEAHPDNEVIQIKTRKENPKCPYCGTVMTYGRYWVPLLATQH